MTRFGSRSGAGCPLEEYFPLIAHPGCDGSVFPLILGNDTELRCTECNAVIGVVKTAVLRSLVLLIPDNDIQGLE